MAKIISSTQLHYLEQLRTERDKLLLEMEGYARENKIPILNWKAAELLEQLVTLKNPKRILEIGTAIGYSSIRMGKKLRKKGVVDTIEHSKANVEKAKYYIKKAKLEKKINILEGDAFLIMPELEKNYDLIFLDADKEDYEKLFYYSTMLLKKRGILFVDNLLWQGYVASASVPLEHRKATTHIRDFNKIFVSQHILETSILPIGDGIGIGIKSG